MSDLHKSIYNSNETDSLHSSIHSLSDSYSSIPSNEGSSPRELNRMNSRSDDSDGYIIDDMNKLKLKEPGHGENIDGFHSATGANILCSKCGDDVTPEKYDAHSSYCKGKGTENEKEWTEITDTWETSWGGGERKKREGKKGEGEKGEEKEE